MIDFKDRLLVAMHSNSPPVLVKELADHLGISYQAVRQVLTGKSRSLSASNTPRAARFLKVDAHWLATGEGEMRPTVPAEAEPIDLDAHPDLVAIRTVKMAVRAGVTGFTVDAEQTDGPPLYFRAAWLRDRGYKPYNLVAFKVRGASMEPTLFNDDTAVANTADTEPKDGKVFAVNYDGEAVIKRMFREGGTWWLSSDNPDQRRFPKRECLEGSCIVIGRVVHRQSEEI